jgi:hypothetical protein
MAAFSPVLASHFATKHLVTHWEVDGSKDFLRFSGFLFDFSDLFTDLARASSHGGALPPPGPLLPV